MVGTYIPNMSKDQINKQLKSLSKGDILYTTPKGVNRTLKKITTKNLYFTFKTNTKAISIEAIYQASMLSPADVTYQWYQDNFNLNPGGCIMNVLKNLIAI